MARWRDSLGYTPGIAVQDRRGTGRTIPLTSRACGALSLWLTRFPMEPDHYVFPRHHIGGRGVLYGFDLNRPLRSWGRAWREALKTTGLQYRWHDLRHTFVSRLAENPAVSEGTIMTLAGHVSKAMLERYSHIRDAAKDVAIDAIEFSQIANTHSSADCGDSPLTSVPLSSTSRLPN
jgi:integrase